MAIKILENLLINKEEWELAPFKFNIHELNFVSGGDTPIPPAPTDIGDLGKLKISATPVTDEKYHLGNGALLGLEDSAELVNYIADLYEDNPSADYFTTEQAWQAEVAQYGVCDKYVYDSTYNTVRIPKYGNSLQGELTAYYYIKVKE